MRFALLITLLAAIAGTASAQAPGTNPIVLSKYQLRSPNGPSIPKGPNGPAVSGRDGNYGSPGGDARMARFHAKIMTLEQNIAANTAEGVATNSTINTVYDEKRKLCVMDIGSATNGMEGFNNYGPAGQAAQPVLIRGTVLNICK
ncbi:MAG: hypothetical protein ACRBC3_20180 [Burkholderiaceae bacterium]